VSELTKGGVCLGAFNGCAIAEITKNALGCAWTFASYSLRQVCRPGDQCVGCSLVLRQRLRLGYPFLRQDPTGDTSQYPPHLPSPTLSLRGYPRYISYLSILG
jgi:hypothetical protein